MSDQVMAPSAPQAPASIAPEVNNNQTQAPLSNDPNQPQQPVTVAEVKKEEAKRLKSLKLKVYGEEVEEQLPFDFEDKPEVIEYLTKQLQMSKAAQRAMQEKGSFEKQVAKFVENLNVNTEQVLRDMGKDPVEFAAKILEAEIEKQKLSPEERRNRELESKLKQLEEDNRKKEEDFRKKEFESHRKQIADRVETQMIQALDKSDLPHTPYVADRIAKYMLLALNNRDENGNPAPVELTPEDVIPLVRDDLFSDVQQMLKGMSEDKIENFIGKDVFTKVRKKNIEKVKSQTPATAKAAIKEVGKDQKNSFQSKEEPRKRARDFFGV